MPIGIGTYGGPTEEQQAGPKPELPGSRCHNPLSTKYKTQQSKASNQTLEGFEESSSNCYNYNRYIHIAYVFRSHETSQGALGTPVGRIVVYVSIVGPSWYMMGRVPDKMNKQRENNC